jgi:hypothetical protein
MNNWRYFMQTIDAVIHWFLCAVLILLGWFLYGCHHPSPVVEYKYVDVPVKCTVEVPARPTKDSDTALAVIDLIAYTRQLEIVIEACSD